MDLQNGMFLYFDKQGNLKEQINDAPLRQGNSGVNKIYVYWEKADSENIVGLWSRYTRALLNEFDTKPSATTYFDDFTKTTGMIPFNQNRDLKYFKYYTDYEFYEITIPDSVLSIGDTSWLCSLWFVLDNDNDDTNNGITQDSNGDVNGFDADEVDIFAMGGVAFYVIPLGLSGVVATDENINIAQWNYLMKVMSYYGQEADNIVLLENAVTILSGRVGDIENNYVTTNTQQTLTGKKIFSAGASFGSPLEMNGNSIEWKTDTQYKNRIVGNGNNIQDYTIVLPNKNGTIAINEEMVTYAKSIEMSIDSNYDLTITLKDANGNILSQQDVDLPLESLITDGYYDSQTESIVLDLESGQTITIPVADLVSGLASESDLEAVARRVVTLERDSAFTYNSQNENYYANGDIDLNDTESTLIVKNLGYIKDANNKTLSSYLSEKQDVLVSGTSIKTINNASILGSGNLSVQEVLISGTNIKTINNNSLLGNGNLAVQEVLVSGTNIKTIDGVSILGSGNISFSNYFTKDGTSQSLTGQIIVDQFSHNGEIVYRQIETYGQLERKGFADKEQLTKSGVGITTTTYTLNYPLKNGTFAVTDDLLSYAKSIELSIDSNYDLVVTLKDANGNTISYDDVDLPLESIITSATYYDTYTYDGTTYTQVIVITLATTSVPTIIPVEDLVTGLVSTTDLANALLDYYTKSQTNNLLDGKANTSDVYTKTQVDNKLGLKANSLDNPFVYSDLETQYNSMGNISIGNHNLYVDLDNVIDGNNTLQDLLTNLQSGINDKQDTLVSGTNIKTINGTSIVGSGNLSVQEVLVDSGANQNIKTINNTSILGNGNLAVQEVLVSGTNIKTIGGTSILGSGDISLSNYFTKSDRSQSLTGQIIIDQFNNGELDVRKITGGYTYNRKLGATSEVITKSALGQTTQTFTINYPLKNGTLAVNEDMMGYAKSLEMSIDSDFDLVITLKDGNGNVLSTQDVDLPLESVVVGGTYDSTNQKIVLTLENGNTIDIPVSDLVSGLVSTTYLTTNYYNKTSIDTSLSSKANSSDLGTQVTMTFSNGVLTITPK